MATTYLEVINKVLLRLREPEVSSVSANDYSKLIGAFINDAKTEIENAWNWSELRNTVTVTTSANIFNYTINDVNTRMRVLNIYNDTDDCVLIEKSSAWFDEQFMSSAQVIKGSPRYYSFNGVNSDGELAIDFYPMPDGVYSIQVNAAIPLVDLAANTDTVYLPIDLLVAGAFSRAIEERGLDGGNQGAEMRYRLLLADYIAIDAARRGDELEWSAV